MPTKTLVTFFDSIQRTLIAKLVEDKENALVVTNPVLVNIVPQTFPENHPKAGQPSGQMALQLLPVYFREFQGDKSGEVTCTYPKSSIVQVDIEGGFDFRLEAQYDQIFNPPAPAAQAPAGMQPSPAIEGQAPAAQAAPVLKLFTDEDETGDTTNG